MRGLHYVALTTFVVLTFVNPEHIFAQANLDNWITYIDPAGRFTIFYPSELHAQGRENFLSSVDLTLGNPNFPREFKITVTYNDDDPSLINYAQGLEISPERYLLAIEDQLRPSYQTYNLVDKPANTDSLYGFPAVTNTVEFTNYLGESGRTMNVLAVINGKGSFIFSYSNSNESFNEYLPIVNQITKSVVILK
ncbi:MAG TPA: hypothetical protein VH415_09395 [Nitrososphaeraceae archaeon]